MSARHPQIWSDCVHEAAHYIAFSLMDLRLPPVVSIRICDDQRRTPHIRTKRLRIHEWNSLVRSESLSLAYAAALLSGDAANLILLGESYEDYEPGEHSDQMKAVRLLDHHVWTNDIDVEDQLSGAILDPLITRAATMAAGFVDDRGRLIEEIAEHLYRNNGLGPSELLRARRTHSAFIRVEGARGFIADRLARRGSVHTNSLCSDFSGD